MSLLISKEEFKNNFVVDGILQRKKMIEYKCDCCGSLTICQLRNWLKKRDRTEAKPSLESIDVNAIDACSRCTVKNSYTPELRALRGSVFKKNPRKITYCNIEFITCPSCEIIFTKSHHHSGWKHKRCKDCFIPGKDWMSKIGDTEKSKIADKMSLKWAGNKNPQFGKPPQHGKWTTLLLDKKEIRFRSRWEAAFAISLFSQNISFEFESEIISLGDTETYTPDFKIGDTYYEIKGFWRQDARNKMELVKKIIPIKIIEHEELTTILGFDPKNDKKLTEYIKPFISTYKGGQNHPSL